MISSCLSTKPFMVWLVPYTPIQLSGPPPVSWWPSLGLDLNSEEFGNFLCLPPNCAVKSAPSTEILKARLKTCFYVMSFESAYLLTVSPVPFLTVTACLAPTISHIYFLSIPLLFSVQHFEKRGFFKIWIEWKRIKGRYTMLLYVDNFLWYWYSFWFGLVLVNFLFLSFSLPEC